MHQDDDLLTPKEAAAFLGSTENSLRSLRSTGIGPAFVRPNGYHVRYRRSDLRAYLAARVARSQKERGPVGPDTDKAPGSKSGD